MAECKHGDNQENLIPSATDVFTDKVKAGLHYVAMADGGTCACTCASAFKSVTSATHQKLVYTNMQKAFCPITLSLLALIERRYSGHLGRHIDCTALVPQVLVASLLVTLGNAVNKLSS